MAVFTGVFCSNTYNIIECTNTDKVCKNYQINSLLKTKRLQKSVDDMKNLYCYKDSRVTSRNETEVTETKYLLTSSNFRPHRYDTLNEYSSSTFCEVDRLSIQTYLNSGSSEPFIYTVSGSWFRFLWYVVSAFFAFIAFYVLFKGRVLTKEEEMQFLNSMPNEKIQKISSGINDFIETVSDIDNSAADFIKKAENTYDDYSINIDIKKDNNN